MDAVLLSGFAKVKQGEKVLDLGTGTGIIPILLAGQDEGGSSHGPGDPGGKRGHGKAKRGATIHLEDRVSIVDRRYQGGSAAVWVWLPLMSSPPIRPI